MSTHVCFIQIMFLSFLQLSSENKFKKLNNCVVNVDNKEIDYSTLNNTNGYEVKHGNSTIILNICGPALKCGDHHVSACLLNEQNDIQLIGSLNYVYIKQLQIKYRYIDNQNTKFETIIDFKCHRHYKTPYVLYDSEPEIGKIYKFVVYTSLVCIKTSPLCKVLDIENNLQYDITPLYSVNKEWIVKNVSKEMQIYLNPCGGLQHLMRNNAECSYEDTHVCLINKNKVSQNLGVFPSTPKINEDSLSINFTGGSLCGNLSTISTYVVFICWFNEMGPILQFRSECEFKIIWKTPIACPYYSSINDNCTLKNNYLMRNQIEGLYPSEDKEKQLTVDTKIKYNICGSLNSNCNGKENISVCLIKEDKEIIFGTYNNTVITKDATISMFLSGELCDYANQLNSVKVLFRCSYNKKSEDIIIDHNLCSATIIAYTTKVCRQTNKLADNCAILANNTEYNLTPLIMNKNNYEIKDPNDSDIVYLLNICSPIILSEDAFCPLDTAVCRKNISEPNLYKRFHSIGHSLKSSGLKIEKNKLSITYEGEICLDSFANYKTKIELLCSDETEYAISVVKAECKYTFILKTKYACCIANNHNHTSDTVTTAPANEKKEADTIKFVKKQDNLILQNTFNGLAPTPNNMLALKNKTTYSVNKQNTPKDTYFISTVSMYIPKKVFNFTSISGMPHNLPEKTNISSTHKRIYLLIMSDTTTVDNNCTTSICLTNPTFTSNPPTIVINFVMETRLCKNGYNSTIILNCHKESNEPSIEKESKCDVFIKWENVIACPIIKSESKNLESPYTIKTGYSSTVTFIIVLTIILVLAVIFTLFFYYRRQRRVINAHSHISLLNNCEYNKLKDAAKIA